MALAVIVTFKVEPAKLDDFCDFLKGSLPDTRGFAGCVGIEAAVDRENAVVILHELWRSKDEQLAYRKWRADRGDSAVYGSFQREAPSFIDYERLDIPLS